MVLGFLKSRMGLDKKSHHDENDGLNEPYRKYIVGKLLFLTVCTILLILLFLYSISRGPSTVSLIDAVHILFGNSTVNAYNILWNIRIPRALTAIVAGVGLSVAGVALQSILRNPLGSPYTLGISNAAAFGAAFSVIVIGTGSMHSSGTDAVVVNQIYVTTFAAFIGAMIATFILLLIAKYKSATPEVMILVGVALGSLFTAGTMFLQYFADDVQLAAVVFWTFGDVGRASWNDLIIMASVVTIATIYFILNRWNYNAIDAGDEIAKGLGVNVDRVRLTGMMVASVVTSFVVALIGIIGFVGLVCPHIARRFVGDEQRYLIPASCLVGGLLLLGADTAARFMLEPHVLPVAILTAFMGAPLFIYLLIKRY